MYIVLQYRILQYGDRTRQIRKLLITLYIKNAIFKSDSFFCSVGGLCIIVHIVQGSVP